MCIVSMSAIRMRALRNDLNPSIGREDIIVRRLAATVVG
jgi:hypothetical protein